jgi:cytochrome c oxidase assembly protein subunit 15
MFFRHLVWLHLGLALTLCLVTFWHWFQLRGCGDLTLTKPADVLVGLIVAQLGMGLFTWVVNYGWPWMMQGTSMTARYIIESGGWWGALITTFHQATGSLILATSGMLWLRVERYRWRSR